MPINANKRRWQKPVIIVLLSVLGLCLIVGLFVKFYLSPILEKKIKTEVANSSDQLYHIDFSSLDFNLFSGRAVLYGIRLSVDTNVYHQKRQLGKAPGNLYELHADRLVLTDMHPFTLYFKKKLTIGRITLNKPDLLVSYYPDQKPDKNAKDKRTLWQKISKSLEEVTVGEIILDEVKLVYKDHTKPKVAVSQFKELNLKAVDLLIDSATQTDTSRFLYCRDLIAELHNYKSRSADGLYNFKINSINLSARSAKLVAAGIILQPADHVTFFNKCKDDRFLLKLDTVKAENFDYMQFQKARDLDISKITLKNGYFEDYSNYNGVLSTTDRIVTFPNWALRNLLKVKVKVDTLLVKHFAVTYRELNKSAMKTGVISFTNTNARFLNITNKPEITKINNICKAELTTCFMRKGKLSMGFNFNLSNAACSYSYNGHLGPMDIAEVNTALMPLSLIKITSGRVKSLDFKVHSTQKTSTGKVSLLYNDLKIDILRSDYTKKTLLSLLANTLILKHDNPDDGNATPRTADVLFMRPANFPFFKAVWQTLLSGIKPCAGVGKAQEEKFNKQTAGKSDKEQQKMLDDAKKQKEQADKDFKKKLEKQQKAAGKKN